MRFSSGLSEGQGNMRLNVVLMMTVCSLVLTGCTGIDTMEKRGPDETYSSSRDTNAVAACIAKGWQERGNMVLSTPLTHGSRVLINNVGTNRPIAFVDVESGDQAVSVKYYKGMGATKGVTELVTRCL